MIQTDMFQDTAVCSDYRNGQKPPDCSRSPEGDTDCDEKVADYCDDLQTAVLISSKVAQYIHQRYEGQDSYT